MSPIYSTRPMLTSYLIQRPEPCPQLFHAPYHALYFISLVTFQHGLSFTHCVFSRVSNHLVLPATEEVPRRWDSSVLILGQFQENRDKSSTSFSCLTLPSRMKPSQLWRSWFCSVIYPTHQQQCLTHSK